MKRVTLSAFCPQLAAGHSWQETEGEGSSLSVAIGRAVDSLLKRPHVKGKRIESLKMTVIVKE